MAIYDHDASLRAQYKESLAAVEPGDEQDFAYSTLFRLLDAREIERAAKPAVSTGSTPQRI